MRLLLVNPRFPESFWSFRWAVDEILPGKRAVNPPLGLATLAALCPPDWEVRIVDENIESIPLEPEADIVGICGMGVQFPRQRELLEYYRSRGCFTVAGGSYASLCPERFAALADCVVCGEAEYIWKRFCADFEAGSPQALYRETGSVALTDSPVPRFDLLKLERYTTATLQFSRGCPFLCDFCDIIVMFGRKPRWKSCEQVGLELDALRARGVRNVFFVDDNLIGNKKAARQLLAFLCEYQERHGYRFSFGTEASINLAQEPELLRLFREASFAWVFIGIESPDPESLKESRKVQNLHEDVLESVRRIYAHGIDVLAGFIVGFDNDTLATFDRQFRFVVDSGIQAAMVGLLTALPHTPLHRRLEAEGRLLPGREGADNTKPGTNFRALRMDNDAMVAAYQALHRSLVRDGTIARRIRNKMRYLRDPVYQGEYAGWERVKIVARLVVKGILAGGPLRSFHFLRSLPVLAPSKLPQAIVDWIAALSMRDYVRRHFVDAQAASVHEMVVLLSEGLNRAFVSRTARHVERLMRDTSSRLTLRIEALREAEARHAQRLLRRLARYGDRISVVAGARALGQIGVDSSVFHVVVQS